MSESTKNAKPAAADARTTRLSVTGVVTSAKMKDTIVVREERMVRHPLYGKYIRRHAKYYAHDAGNTAGVGDEVEIVQTRPISKLKNWRLVRIVRKSEGGVAHADTDALPAAAAAPAPGSKE